MKRNNKQKLFEVLSKLDSTFKPKLNEEFNTVAPINEAGSNSPVHKYVMFSYNYPYDFIQKVWGSSGSVSPEHLQGKFDMYYDKYGAQGVMNAFYVNLDAANQQVLESWIENNYNG